MSQQGNTFAARRGKYSGGRGCRTLYPTRAIGRPPAEGIPTTNEPRNQGPELKIQTGRFYLHDPHKFGPDAIQAWAGGLNALPYPIELLFNDYCV
jgi:hypothetical protein